MLLISHILEGIARGNTQLTTVQTEEVVLQIYKAQSTVIESGASHPLRILNFDMIFWA